MRTAKEKLLDPLWFIQNLLYIVDKDGRYRRLDNPRPEQVQIVQAWQSHPNVCVLKPRQIGSSTITQALSFRDALLCPDPLEVLTMAHESGACGRMNMMLRNFHRGLPKALRFPLAKDNAHEIGFGHNGATLRQYMAGGRGQGRSRTYQQAIFTEMGLYPTGSASVKGKVDVDRDVFASVLATMHKSSPYYKLVVESTGDGPGGMFHDIVRIAQEDPSWAFLFFRWTDFPMYEMEPPEGFELRPDEREYSGQFLADLDPVRTARKMAWRRFKMESEGISEMRFRREYPITWQEPFLLSESTWFDAEMANAILGRIPPEWRRNRQRGKLRVYHEPEEGRKYFIGMDTSGGTGGDYAVIVVLRDDFEVCAVWQSNTTPPHEQANEAAKLSATYNGAVVLCEENNYGRQVNDRLELLGAPVYRGADGKRFWSQGGRAGQSKKMVYGYARQVFNDGIAASSHAGRPGRVNDEDILGQIIVVREDDRGNIQAPEGMHDDHVDAWVFALWCGRYYHVRAAAAKPEDPERVKARRMGIRL